MIYEGGLCCALPCLSPYWFGQISVEIYEITKHRTKISTCQQTGTELVPEVGHEGKGADDVTSAEKGIIMHTTTIMKIVAKMSIAPWLEGLSASLASFLAVAQPRWALSCASRPQSKALYAGWARSQSAPLSAMLVASDVSQRSYGLVP